MISGISDDANATSRPPASRGVSEATFSGTPARVSVVPVCATASRTSRSRTGTGIANASLVPAPRTLIVAVAVPAPVATTGKRYAVVILSSVASSDVVATGLSFTRNASGPASAASTCSDPLAPVPFVTATPPSNLSPGRANCGITGLATSGLVVRNVVSPLPNRASVVVATTITRHVVRSSGSVNVALASPLASVFSAPAKYASGSNLRRTRGSASSPDKPPPKPQPFSTGRVCVLSTSALRLSA